MKKNMELLGIENFSNRSFQDLSGGQQQRVLLARALCATKKLLLLDEPVTGLDPLVTSDMYNIIKKLNREYGITIIMISHDLSGALDAASHILHLHKHPLFYGTKEDYLKTAVGKKFTGGNEI
jgi:zinc transport system ATP-binding protein